MLIGVSSACLYPMKTESAVETLLLAGVKNLEIFLNSYQELQPDFLRSLKNQLDASGARVLSVHPFTSAFEHMLFFSDYSRRIEDGMQLYRHFFHAAQMLGSPLLVLHGSRKKIPILLTAEQYAQRFEQIFLLGMEYGVITAQENVVDYQSQDPEFIFQLRSLLGSHIRFVLDCKQCRRANCSIEEIARAMGEGLLHLHLSDHNGKEDCMLPGRGVFDFSVFHNLRSIYCPNLQSAVLELYQQSFSSVKELSDAYSFLLQVFS